MLNNMKNRIHYFLISLLILTASSTHPLSNGAKTFWRGVETAVGIWFLYNAVSAPFLIESNTKKNIDFMKKYPIFFGPRLNGKTDQQLYAESRAWVKTDATWGFFIRGGIGSLLTAHGLKKIFDLHPEWLQEIKKLLKITPKKKSSERIINPVSELA